MHVKFFYTPYALDVYQDGQFLRKKSATFSRPIPVIFRCFWRNVKNSHRGCKNVEKPEFEDSQDPLSSTSKTFKTLYDFQGLSRTWCHPGLHSQRHAISLLLDWHKLMIQQHTMQPSMRHRLTLALQYAHLPITNIICTTGCPSDHTIVIGDHFHNHQEFDLKVSFHCSTSVLTHLHYSTETRNYRQTESAKNQPTFRQLFGC